MAQFEDEGENEDDERQESWIDGGDDAVLDLEDVAGLNGVVDGDAFGALV